MIKTTSSDREVNMGFFDFSTGDAVEDQGVNLFKAASVVGREMCCSYGVIGRLHGAVLVEAARAEMIVTSALMHCVTCRFLHEYLARNPHASKTDYQKFCYSACNAGREYYGQEFAVIMQRGQEHLYSDDAANRIAMDAGDSLGLQMSLTVECVDWCLKMLNDGVPSDMMTRNQMAFLMVTHAFDVFATQQKLKIKF